MTALLKFGSRNGKTRTLLVLYILHSLGTAPRSGYDLRKEIGDVTRGTWIPSKGALYPLLHQLEGEGLIAVQATGNRRRALYRRTEKGGEMLHAITERGKEHRQKMILYKDLILAIFGTGIITPRRLLFEIKVTAETIPSVHEKAAIAILEQCLTDLKELTT